MGPDHGGGPGGPGGARGPRGPPPRPWLLVLAAALILSTFALIITTSHRLGGVSGSGPQVEVEVYGHEVTDPRPPRGPPPLQVPSIMMDLFRRGPHEQLAAEIVRSITPVNVDQLHHRQPEASVREHLHLLTFSIPAPIPGETLHSAQLRLTVAFLDGNRTPTIDVESTVRLYLDSMEPYLSLEVLDQSKEKTVNVNCTDIIKRFHNLQKAQGGELQLVVGVTISSELKVYPLLEGNTIDNQPLLLLLYSPTRDNAEPTETITKGRRRREIDHEDYEEETNEVWPGAQPTRARIKRPRNYCRRRPLYVEFSDIHYDSWIVAPNGYQAYQCVGRCMYPLSDHLSPTKHAIIQTLLHSVHPTMGGRACCVPTSLDSISILYLDSQGVLTYRLSYKDMVVTECGCR